ncbi:uncharacterized protein LOC130712741 [Lotus japonicus]|uniref:uncharacterized protein LOC130712741 n=1 Tax=Lotus japonicus TaxID=34305 RepID=UPI0025842670|nr:uncharacterized protein LOC130712741 [Lotus japonicus]
MYYHVEDLFFKIGRVANMYIQRARKRTRKSKFGFVRFFTSAEATKAIQELDGILVNGAAMHLSYARFPLFQDKANCNVVGGNQSGKSFKQIWVHKKKKGVAVPLDSVVRVASREDGKNRVERTLIASSPEDFVSAEQSLDIETKDRLRYDVAKVLIRSSMPSFKEKFIGAIVDEEKVSIAVEANLCFVSSSPVVKLSEAGFSSPPLSASQETFSSGADPRSSQGVQLNPKKRISTYPPVWPSRSPPPATGPPPRHATTAARLSISISHENEKVTHSLLVLCVGNLHSCTQGVKRNGFTVTDVF